ncbi:MULTISPECIES: TonB-dependent receptor [Pedobacter]|uniref:TonB-dependent receptor n=1 Tax=Pedobacter heparinus (strain ATCC 13125 / DSM 2366 / CIP 104194 / JCM 7457 / NBRC 12017 / NCIMB 9290 / NRRL B-14731 / HIM 762-3) TaxID=485917 RepID=C6Y259_PEDHD|nr:MULTISPECIES: TonB-dependent receptor [Pedobacter]ACU03052.1 TonB-dependent receptor [Pedobacter heparinus DSM 2366]MBB5438431.1 TonB-dependent receptor [Pedobacter sp. AK017]
MKSQLHLKKALITALFVIIGATVFAQTGKISGKVSDKKTGETLIGVTVKIKGTTKGMATDVDGKYSITGLATGKYILVFQYVGYTGKEISGVEVVTGKNTIFDVILDEAGGQKLNEVVIQGSFKKESINALYAQQKNSAVISDGVSSEIIKRSPDKNTSDVLKRVSGATIQDNKFVVIRGLSDRYNTATLDGASLPSTEPNRKAFSFDIVPSNLVENLIVSKTATPDLPADFTGGAIQISTKDIPDNNFISIGVGAGYNSASTFKNFKSGVRTATDYFGFDNGDKSLPSNFPSRNRIIGGALTTEQGIAAMNRLPSDWKTYNNTALPTQNYQFTLGRVKDFKDSNNKFGALISLTYRNSQTISNDVIRDYVNVDYHDNIYKFSTNIGALANFAYTYGKSKITFKNIYNRTFDDQYLSRAGYNSDRNRDIKFYAFDLMQKSLFKSTLEGTHALGENNSKINWSLSYANILNDQPDQKKISYQRNPSDIGTDNYAYIASTGTVSKENSRLFSKLNENNFSGGLNYTLPVKMFGQGATFKTGLNSIYRDRKFDARFIGFRANSSSPDADAISRRPLRSLYAKDAINSGAYFLDDISADADSYTAHSLTNAGYLMLDNKFGEKSRLVWGVRVEQFNVVLDAKVPTPQTSVDDNYIDVLPSANYTYSLTDKINLRASYYRTLARPEFRELASTSIYDYELLALQQGNPNLKEAKIDNADIRFEFYPQAGQIISVSAFYKKFNNAIESFNSDGGSSRIITYINSDKVNVYGVELEFRKSLDFIAKTDFLEKTIFYTNLSLIKSKVETNNTGINLKDTSRPMVGQAPYIINAGLQHSFLSDKLNFNALYNRVGRKLNVAGGVLFPAIWEAPRNVVDLQVALKVIKNKGEIKFNAGDILNNRITQYYDNDSDKKYNRAKGDETISSYKPGSNYSVSFNYTF